MKTGFRKRSPFRSIFLSRVMSSGIFSSYSLMSLLMNLYTSKMQIARYTLRLLFLTKRLCTNFSKSDQAIERVQTSIIGIHTFRPVCKMSSRKMSMTRSFRERSMLSFSDQSIHGYFFRYSSLSSSFSLLAGTNGMKERRYPSRLITVLNLPRPILLVSK